MNWNDIYEQFPVNREMIWLNNCGTTPSGAPMTAAVAAFLDEFSKRGVFARGYSYESIKNRIQELLARLLNCKPEEVALIHNTSEGMNLISWGLRLRKGDRILLLENEYPSNVYPWMHWKAKGVAVDFIPLAPTPAQFLANFKRSLTPETRAVAISAVHWCTGMPLPLAPIAAICREQGIFLAIDGAQGVGHVPIDMRELAPAVLAFSCWKWLLGPLGMGCLVVPEDTLSRLDHVFMGTDSVVRSQEYLPYRTELKPTAERYMYSTGSSLDWIYLQASLEFLDGIGFSPVMQRIHELASHLAGILRGLGFTVLADAFPDRGTGMILAGKEGVDCAVLEKALLQNNIIARERLGRMRFAPHVYNSEEQIEQLGRVLKKILGAN